MSSKCIKKIKPLAVAIVLYGLAGAVASGVVYLLFRESFADFAITMTLFFLLIGVVYCWLVDRAANSGDPKKLTSIFMVARMGKLLTVATFMLICVTVTEWNHKEFAFSLLIFYFLYMFLDLAVYYSYNKREKELREQK